MTSDLKSILEFCVENELLDAETSLRIACENERYSKSAKSVVVSSGVDERKMYEKASEIHQLELLTLDQINVEQMALDCIPLNHATQLFCIPYNLNETILSVVTSDWDKLEVVSKGMANITGKTIQVNLISNSDYICLKESLTNK